jgi:hypothetical protein
MRPDFAVAVEHIEVLVLPLARDARVKDESGRSWNRRFVRSGKSRDFLWRCRAPELSSAMKDIRQALVDIDYPRKL